MAVPVRDALTDLRHTIAAAAAVQPVGGRTHWGVGNPPADGLEVHAPAGVVAYDPAELTVTVGAGTPVRDLAAVLDEAGQECPLDPRSLDASVGGTIAAGLSGPRRLRYGPLRDRVLEVRFVTADGRVVKGGGPTVKNVSGYDLPRLVVGSLGTIGVLVQTILRCQPCPPCARWCASSDDPFALRRLLSRPSCISWDGRVAHVLLEGYADDVVAEQSGAGLEVVDDAPAWPDGAHRGRISVQPGRLRDLGRDLDSIGGLRWLAEVGVGTVHVAADTAEPVLEARRVAEGRGGWLLREDGLPGVDGFGVPLPNLAIVRRLREAFDPTGKLAPGRLPGEPACVSP